MFRNSLIACLVIFYSAVQSQTVAIKGTISDPEGPIPGATVQISGTSTGTVSNSKGEFEINQIETGTYTLKFRAIGFIQQEQKVTLNPGEDANLHVVLKPDTYNLREVVVSGTRTERFRKDLPIAIDVINPEVFEASQSVCLVQGLNYQAGLRTEVDCQTCNYSQIRMNGLPGGYTQILINSRPIFSPLNGLYGLEQIPANMIERVEIVRGGGSALFGSNAIAGTVNIITKIPAEDSYDLSINHSLINGEANDNVLNFNISEVNENSNAGFTAYANRRQRQEFDANGDGFSELPRIANHSFGLNAFVKPTDKAKLGLAINAFHEKRDGGDQLDEAPHKRTQSEFRDSDIVSGNLDFNLDLSENQSISMYAGGQYTIRNHYTGVFGQDGYGNTENATFQSGIQHYTSFSMLNGTNNLVSGVEFQVDDVLDQIPNYNYKIDQLSRQWGIFIQSDWAVTKELTFLAGVRGNLHNLVDNMILTPRAGFMYSFAESSKFRFTYARGFRAPQAFDTDLHIAFAGGGIATIQIDPELQSEFSNSFTASYDFDKFSTNSAWGFTLSGFHTNLYDAFVLEELGTDDEGNMRLEKRNGGDATVTGATLETRAKWEGIFELNAGFTWQESVYDQPIAWSADIEGSRQFLRTPDVYGFYTVTLLDGEPFNLYLSGVHTGPMNVPHFGGAPGVDGDRLVITENFVETNLKMSYKLDLPKLNNQLSFSLGVQNLFDAYQRDFDIGPERDSNYVYGPALPRTFFVGLKFGKL